MHQRPCNPASPRPDRPGAERDFVLFLLGHGLAGMLAGAITVAALLWSDMGGLGTLVAASDLWPVPLVMLLVAFGFTFASVALGSATVVTSRETRHAGGVVRPPAGEALRVRAQPPAPARDRRNQ